MHSYCDQSKELVLKINNESVGWGGMTYGTVSE